MKTDFQRYFNAILQCYYLNRFTYPQRLVYLRLHPALALDHIFI